MFEAGKSVFNIPLKYRVPVKVSKEKAWEKFRQQVSTDMRVKRKRAPKEVRIYMVAGMAAAILMLMGIIYVFRLQMEIKTFRTGTGERMTVMLPDSSKVILNSESFLEFDPERWKNKRVVSMEGEAFFSVKNGMSFIVGTQLGDIRVVGTKFSVIARNSDYKVYCFQGKVRVRPRKKTQSVVLVQGQFTRRLEDDSMAAPRPFDRERVASWRNGRVSFVNVPFDEVLFAFKKHYHIEIRSEDLSGRHYTGYFPHDDMNKALELICTPMNLRYKIIDKTTIEIEAK